MTTTTSTPTSTGTPPIPYFQIKDLKVNFNSYDGKKTILDIAHLEINRGETYGIVGESGARSWICLRVRSNGEKSFLKATIC